MEDKIETFIHRIIDEMDTDEELKKRVAQDLHANIMDASQNQNLDEVLINMGKPSEIAKEFMDSMQNNTNEMTKMLIQRRLKNYMIGKYFIEYRSKIKFLGLPMVHVKFGHRQGSIHKIGIAKGVIAIGNIAIGIIALGGITFGLVAIGGISAGIIAIGGLSVGALSIGGISIGLFAIGGLCVGVYTIGAKVSHLWNILLKYILTLRL